MKNVKLTIEFIGTDYKGWQVQSNGVTIQEEIEKRIMVLTKEKVRLHSSGRTDAGVHAKGMVANFLTERELDLNKFKKSLNALLPDDISVIGADYVDPDFHARKSAKRKVYEYRILNRLEKSPFLTGFSWHVRKPLNLDDMRRAAGGLIGEHDFTSFASVGGKVRTNIRTIYDIVIEKAGDEVIVTCTGSGFLKQMVRNIAGLLVQVGLGKFSADFAAEILQKKVVEKPYITAPARGLFLKEVVYK